MIARMVTSLLSGEVQEIVDRKDVADELVVSLAAGKTTLDVRVLGESALGIGRTRAKSCLGIGATRRVSLARSVLTSCCFVPGCRRAFSKVQRCLMVRAIFM